MEDFKRAWREAVAPLLSLEALEVLRRALVYGDPRHLLAEVQRTMAARLQEQDVA